MPDSVRQSIMHSLRRELADIENRRVRLAIDPCPDANEYASRVCEHLMEVAILERGVRRIRDIRRALDRMAEPGWGTCLECGEPIAPARLAANPVAVLCVICQEELESTTAA